MISRITQYHKYLITMILNTQNINISSFDFPKYKKKLEHRSAQQGG